MWTPNLRLGAIATYMLNALIYRAGEREEELTLIKSSALYCHADEDPTCGDDDDNDNDEDFKDKVDELEHYVPIGDRQGLYFLARIVEDQQTYRLSKVQESELPPSHLLWLYRVSSTEDLATVDVCVRPVTTDIKHLRRDEPPVLNMELNGLNLRFWQTTAPMMLDGAEVTRDVILPRHVKVEEVQELDKKRQTMTTQHILPEDHTGGGVWILLNSWYFNPARFVVTLLPRSVDLESSDEDERRGCGRGRGRDHGQEDENEDEEEDKEERGMEVA
ncbi:hypothetical protein WOLCODRAFT_148562 [Wolfiporia cocos MD-104 SS10]|uniref:Uncharacterized protein n=1 Tax=Wolfiporia cocos (strain MD-104) TaxID=742152 RepID=A0A2H3J5U9_WOLCO|nr:hypothetical protein WOLCODRAFT_148562 [Wolfiporia cocos MD-104 SS10]